MCRGPMPPPKRMGRRRIYCSDACRVTAQHKGIDRAYHNKRGQWLAIPGDELEELRRRRFEGWSKQQLATTYGVSLRTIDRYLSRSAPVLVEVGPWRAWFAVTLNGTPKRVGEWTLTPARKAERNVAA